MISASQTTRSGAIFLSATPWYGWGSAASLIAHTAGTAFEMFAHSAEESTNPEHGELNIPSAMSVRAATYSKNSSTPRPPCASMNGFWM